ncbi:MAG TPA: tail fiber protein [Pyrinomonadaceae bacterium]|jgi:microcystin-dependent protein|nr:tail fiber protein [Pyrinomonadaceae bacterium]
MMHYTGQICIFPYEFEPEGWMYCRGQLLPIGPNQALFTLIGNRFGGDGQSSFAVPNYQGLAPAGSNYFICFYGNYPVTESAS